MALRTVDEYKQGLRDGRRVYLAGKRVDDVTAHPDLSIGVETAAFDFRIAHDPAMTDVTVMKDPHTGEQVSAYFDIPDEPGKVKTRHELVKSACYYADGAIPFVKDVGTDLLNALTVVSRMLGNADYVRRVEDYRWHCARNDLAMCGAVTDVKGDRTKSPSQQSNPDAFLRVVDETDDAIVVRGAKAHITASAYTDEILVIPTRAMNEAEADYAVAFAVPVSTPGISHVCRPCFRHDDGTYFPTPNPRRGHSEALVVFDDVRVPKERVFLLREHQAAQYLAYAFSAFHRFTAVTYKIPIIEYMVGLGMLAAEANGIHKATATRERFVSMINYTETTKALAAAAIAEPQNFAGSGLYVANCLRANMAKLHFASGFHDMMREVQEIAGGLLATQPSYQDWQNAEVRPMLEHYLGGAGKYDGHNRLKLMSTLHHVFASEFAGWHQVCTIHAEGSTATQKMMLLAEAPSDEYKSLAKRMVGLDL